MELTGVERGRAVVGIRAGERERAVASLCETTRARDDSADRDIAPCGIDGAGASDTEGSVDRLGAVRVVDYRASEREGRAVAGRAGIRRQSVCSRCGVKGDRADGTECAVSNIIDGIAASSAEKQAGVVIQARGEIAAPDSGAARPGGRAAGAVGESEVAAGGAECPRSPAGHRPSEPRNVRREVCGGKSTDARAAQDIPSVARRRVPVRRCAVDVDGERIGGGVVEGDRARGGDLVVVGARRAHSAARDIADREDVACIACNGQRSGVDFGDRGRSAGCDGGPRV